MSNDFVQSSDGIRWRAEWRPCPVCGSDNPRVIGTRGGRAHREGKGIETNVVQCMVCEIIYTRPVMIPETNPYDKTTSDEYFYNHDSKLKESMGESIAAYAEKVLRCKGKMLELGCGRGELLVGAAKRGWEVYGVEMTDDFARKAASKGINVEQSSIQKSSLLNQTGRYDVILLAAILEHLYDPLETLHKVHKALRIGELVFIDVPNEMSLTMRIGNLYMRLRGRDWCVNLSPTFSPFHVVGFSPNSLRKLLVSSGFRIHRLDVVKWNNAFPQTKNLVEAIEKFSLEVVQYVGAVIGMGDGIVCWAIRE